MHTHTNTNTSTLHTYTYTCVLNNSTYRPDLTEAIPVEVPILHCHLALRYHGSVGKYAICIYLVWQSSSCDVDVHCGIQWALWNKNMVHSYVIRPQFLACLIQTVGHPSCWGGLMAQRSCVFHVSLFVDCCLTVYCTPADDIILSIAHKCLFVSVMLSH